MQPNNSYNQQPAGGGQPGQAPPMFQPSAPHPSMSAPMQPAPAQSAGSPHHRPIGLIITIILLVLLLCGAGGFGAWAYSERQDYMLNVEEKVAAAVEVAKTETTEANRLEFIEQSKNPLKSYTGPSSFGTIKVEYPKTWSGFIDDNGRGSAPLTTLFHPDVVPLVSGSSDRKAIALKIEVRQEAYDRAVSTHNSRVNNGDLRARPYALPKMKDQVGTRFTGKLSERFTGTQIVLPLRDKSIVITSETEQYLADFEKYILPNITFVP